MESKRRYWKATRPATNLQLYVYRTKVPRRLMVECKWKWSHVVCCEDKNDRFYDWVGVRRCQCKLNHWFSECFVLYLYCFVSVNNLTLYLHIMYLDCPPANCSWRSSTEFHMQNLEDENYKTRFFWQPRVIHRYNIQIIEHSDWEV